MAWFGRKKLNLTQRKQAFTNQKKCTTTQNKQEKLKPGSVAFYNIQPGNGAGLFSKEKISKGGDNKEKVKKKIEPRAYYAPKPAWGVLSSNTFQMLLSQY